MYYVPKTPLGRGSVMANDTARCRGSLLVPVSQVRGVYGLFPLLSVFEYYGEFSTAACMRISFGFRVAPVRVAFGVVYCPCR
jgi:hypothetical protein